MVPSHTGWHRYWPVAFTHDLVIAPASRIQAIVFPAIAYNSARFYTRLIHPKAWTIPGWRGLLSDLTRRSPIPEGASEAAKAGLLLPLWRIDQLLLVLFRRELRRSVGPNADFDDYVV
jgi:hypothetical protein